MAGAVIGALRVTLGADTASLEKGFKDAQGSLASFAAGMAKSAAFAATALAAAGVAIGVGIKKTINEMDGLNKSSQKIGVPVEALSALKYAADLSDVSMETLTSSLGKLSKNMVEAAAKPTSEAANAFRALGVSVTDSSGKLKPTATVISDVAGKFEGLKDGAGKTAVAMALFGKAGAEMIPFLNTGKKGLADMADEAAHFGIIISSGTAKSAEGFNDNLTRLHAVMNGLFVQLTSALLPSLLKFSEIIIQAAKDGDLAKNAANSIGGALLGLTEKVMSISLWFQRLGVEWAAFRELMQTDVFSGKISDNFKKFKDTLAETELQQLSLKASFENDPIGNTGAALAALAPKFDTASKAQKDFNFGAMAGKTALDGFIDSTRKSLAAQQATLQADGMAAGAKERLKVVLQAYQVAVNSATTVTGPLRAAITALGNEAEQTALKIQGQQLITQVTPIWQQYTQELNNNAAALRAVGATGEQLAASAGKTAEKYGLSWKQQVPGVVGSFADIASAFGKEGSKMAAAAKVLGAVQALISTYAGSAEALNLPFPANIAASAAVLAKGLGLVAAIRSATVPKMATGGVFNVPGGIGGGDKVPISFLAQPGEQVKVEPNRYGNGPQGGSQSQTLEVKGLNPRDMFSGDYVRALADRLLQFQRDGGQIVFSTR